MTQGSVSSSGQTGSTASGTTTYGVTTNYRTVKWNNEFYGLSASDRGVHTLHEALHQVAGFSGAALAEAPKKSRMAELLAIVPVSISTAF
jgi:hypothetical protein